ncbi:hypothetical protein ThidrDRAFT_2376 [Thiorhodococcus drewsii AZ1]|uniref:YecA family protein n=1 Tax=Thiorhodococcus drewsii AZ1 TaxID=765913 RepID=G2E263_9GAMM|nr:UPF0149 family protein [Thiorhodococcus drewsii]EGV31012.1 hypothetical protein ThidrDRAFT_2376 [Thiorhodococcus drewsii AZ1]
MIERRYSNQAFSLRRGDSTDNQYDEVEQLLRATHLVPSPSEAHGILVGFVCAGAEDPVALWLDHLLSEQEAENDALSEARGGLQVFAHSVAEEVQARGDGLTLLLPSEEGPLLERATGIYDWVRGFLYAVGVLELKENDLSDQSREVIRDFADLTRMDLSDLEETEENEEALVEITEFVRVAAMLIQEERSAPPLPSAGEPT